LTYNTAETCRPQRTYEMTSDCCYLFVVVTQMNTTVVNTNNNGSDCYVKLTVTATDIQPHPVTLNTHIHIIHDVHWNAKASLLCTGDYSGTTMCVVSSSDQASHMQKVRLHNHSLQIKPVDWYYQGSQTLEARQDQQTDLKND